MKLVVWSRGARAASAAIVTAAALNSGCTLRQTPHVDYGIPRCPAAAADALLSPDALQCWFEARHGRWRILSHVSFHDALVVEVEAASLEDADEITRRFTAGESSLFSEILVYTQTEPDEPSSRVRRVRWTKGSGYDVLEFPSS